MTCSGCGATAAEAARFCPQCGRPLEGGRGHACAVCGAVIPEAARYCTACGAASPPAATGAADGGRVVSALQRLMPREYVEQLLAARGRVSGERRVITILFFDVKGSTALAEDLDPEEVMEIMNEAFAVLLEPVYRHEGTLARLMGDGILCFFGAPIAHEDDPVRACHCALDILAAARRYAERLERERGLTGFAVRVGIHTGLVVVGEVGADLRVEYTAMGDAVNLAARMEAAAEPGTARITEQTYRLLRGRFACEDLGPTEVRGRSRPVRALRLLGPAPAGGIDGNLEGEVALRAALVGRDAEMEEFRQALAGLRSGRGGRLVILGEAGVGKSRLLREARERAGDGIAWCEGRCLPDTEGTSHWLARDVVRRMLGLSPLVPAAEAVLALRRELAASLPERADEALPFLASVLELPLEGELRARVAHLEPEALQAGIAGALRGILGGRAQLSPLVAVLEDLHWIDPSSLRLLESLLPLTDEAPLLLVLVYRGGEGAIRGLHPRLESDGRLSSRILRLAPLAPEESERLVGNLLGTRGVPAEVLRLVLSRAEGNAFYLEELLRALLGGDGLELHVGPARLAGPAGGRPVPDTLQGVIMARIDRLGSDEKRLLQTASVLGRAFALALLERVMERPAGAPPLAESLEGLRRRGFLLRSGEPGAQGPPVAAAPGEFVFRHALTQEVAYGSLLRSERRDLHRRTGEAIEVLVPDRVGEIPLVLADHFEKGGVRDRAFHYLVRAAEAAARVNGNQEAGDCYRRALALAAEPRPGGAAPDPLSPRALALANEGLADVHYRMGEYEPAMQALADALPLHEDPVGRAAVQRKRGQVCEKRGCHAEARAWFEAGLQEMQGADAEIETARIYTGLSLVHYHEGRLNHAVMVGEMALAAMRRLGDTRGVAQAAGTLGISYGVLGDWEVAIGHLTECLTLSEQLSDAYGLATVHNNLGLAWHRRGDAARAVQHFAKSAALFESLGNRHGLARACDNLSEAHLVLGDEAESQRHLERAVTLLADLSVAGSEIQPELWRSGVW
jgi:class 3 adenylate cyclase/tetratricopeptide (TPR) repeat protein